MQILGIPQDERNLLLQHRWHHYNMEVIITRENSVKGSLASFLVALFLVRFIFLHL